MSDEPMFVTAWEAEPLSRRLMNCVRMLAIHQMLSERERDKACARIRKRFAKAEREKFHKRKVARRTTA